jgi:TetR/AcrR family transcriptional repressor of nem operon
MRYKAGRKEATRERIIEVASQQFRKQGIAATGLAGLLKKADFTIGAFYPHFTSKSQLVTEMLAEALRLEHSKVCQLMQAGGGLEAAVRMYLSSEHMAHPEEGCPSAAMLPEVARQTKASRVAYKDGLLPFIDMVAESLPGDKEAAKGLAFAIFGLMVGSLQIARAIPEPALADRVLEEGIKAAMRLADAPESSVATGTKKEARGLSRRSSPRSKSK